jgi:hypothetical protein
MNTQSALDDEQLFTLPEWTMRLEAQSGTCALGTYQAHVFRYGVAVCSIALAGSFTDRSSASAAVSKRLGAWLLGYESKPLTSDSGFQVL